MYSEWIENNPFVKDNRMGSRNCWVESVYVDLIKISHFGGTLQYDETRFEHMRIYLAEYWWCEEVLGEPGPGTFYNGAGGVSGSGTGVTTDLQTPPNNMIDLDCWQNGLTASVKAEIKELLSTTYSPCDEDAIEDLVTHILIDKCTERSENESSNSDNDPFLETLEDALFGQEILDEIKAGLEGKDYIVEDKSFRLACPKLYCVYNKMLMHNNNFICKYVAPTFNSDKFKITIKVAEAGAGSSGHFTYNAETKEGELTFDPILCNKTDQVGLMAIILHEFVHVELARQMYGKGLDINNLADWYTFYPKYVDFLIDKYNTLGMQDVHHHMMIEFENIINKMAETLYNIFNGGAHGLTIDHFKLTAANGMFTAMEYTSYKVEGFDLKYGDFISRYASQNAIMHGKQLSIGCQ